MFDYVVVADDYTGAVETAAKFMNGGYRTAVTLDSGSLGSLRKYSVVAVDTETFFSSPERAGGKLENVARDLMPWKDSTVFFKRIEPGGGRPPRPSTPRRPRSPAMSRRPRPRPPRGGKAGPPSGPESDWLTRSEERR